ncbi:PAS domain S-box protein [Sorangium sp. So ce315]|uniref:PAS domain-containing hybrid sensor histidine kinase/response regulator n=1 Tax=Sorangium sp. So ce315 TaxID=3133299 RepID=UPI003F5DC2BC
MPETCPTHDACEGGPAAGELQLKAALLDQVSEAALAWELGGTCRIVYFGPGAERLHGIPAGDAVGRSRHDLLSAGFPAPLAEIEGALEREGRWAGELRHTARDGRQILIESRMRLVEGGEGLERRRVVLETGRDITVRWRAEDGLREGEARFRNMADHAPVMIWITEPDGTCTYANRRWLDFTGQTESDVLGLGWLDAVHPEDRPAAEEALLGASARRGTYRMDFRVRRADGAYRWCIDSASPRLGPRGEFLGYIGSIIDITDRKHAELLLQESEERLRRAVMAAPFPMMIHAEDGQIINVNRAWLELSGYTREQIPTIDAWTERAYGPRKDAARAAIEAVYDREGRAIEEEFTITTASGAPRTWVFSGALLGEDAAGRRLVISAAHDITERERIADALRESEARFRELADAMPQIVWTADPEGRIDYCSRQWCERTGAAVSEALGEGWVDFVHPDDLERCLAEWRRAVVTGEPYESEFRFGGVAGREHRWCLCRAVPVRGPEGHIARWYGTATDIHDQKCAEARLKEADQRKDEFLAMLAHELRNPLGPIRNAVEILRRVAGQQPSLARACGVLDRQVSHMARLVDDLLDVSRVARGRIQLCKERCDLARLLQETAEDYRSTLEASGLSLELALPAEPVWVSGDPTRLSQAISNVLHNANKFTDAGGRVTVTLSATSERSAAIRVRDTGIGMEPAMLGRMFEPFSQADRSLDRSRGGLGLGLSLVKGVVELHGGTVSAESAGTGRGTEIVLRLPLSRGPEPSLERAAPPSGVDSRSLRVLIIEDNQDAAETLQALLAMDGHRVEVALSGRAGVEAARSFRPDVILCDIGLPGGMDGYAVARALKGSAGLSPSLMIALTGYGQEDDRRRVLEAGFDLHVVKPLDPTSLPMLLARSRSGGAVAGGISGRPGP